MTSKVKQQPAFIERLKTKTKKIQMVLRILTLMLYIFLVLHHEPGSSIKHDTRTCISQHDEKLILCGNSETKITIRIIDNTIAKRFKDDVPVTDPEGHIYQSENCLNDCTIEEEWKYLLDNPFILRSPEEKRTDQIGKEEFIVLTINEQNKVHVITRVTEKHAQVISFRSSNRYERENYSTDKQKELITKPDNNQRIELAVVWTGHYHPFLVDTYYWIKETHDYSNPGNYRNIQHTYKSVRSHFIDNIIEPSYHFRSVQRCLVDVNGNKPGYLVS